MISKHDTSLPQGSGADRGFTPKQQRFIEEYTVDLNATQAAIRAGYSPKTARTIGSQNLKHPAVKMAIQEALRARRERLQVSSDDVTSALAAVAFSSPRTAVKWDPEQGLVVKPDPNIIESVRRVTRTDPKTGRTRRIVSIKFRDRTRAILALGRHLGFV